MVYVSGDGTVYQERPWGVGKVMAIFWAIINLIVAFFQTLIPGFMDSGTSSTNGFRSSSGSGRGSGSSGGYGGGSYGGRRPPRPPGPGNVRGMGSLRSPPGAPPACGSCCGL